MLIKVVCFSIIWTLFLMTSCTHGNRDNSFFFGNDVDVEDRHLGKRRRPGGYQGNQADTSPCNFGGGGGGGYGRRPKNEGSGRTFFDFEYYNVEHNYNLNIDCGSHGGSSSYPIQPAPVNEIHSDHGGHKPLGGLGGHRPQKPHKPGNGGGLFGSFFGGGNNKPQKPLQGGGGGPFRPTSPSEGGSNENPGGSTGAFSGAFAGFFPKPSQVANGLSEGLQTFIGTIPAIGQSFQSILPSFSDFQWPQFPQFNPGANTGPVTFGPLFQGAGSGSSSSGFSNPFNRPPSAVAGPVATTTPTIVTSPPLTTTTDPDDVIYSDEIKPVHEDYDPITDPYNIISNKLRVGNLAPGQYLVISNPYLGSYTQDLSAFKPTNLYNKWQQGVKEVLEAGLKEFGSYF